MAFLSFFNDITRAHEQVEGSDGRLNVSARADGRSYYVSRDNSLSFSLLWRDASSSAEDFVLYWKNTDATGKHLVIEAVGFNSEFEAAFELHTVTGTAAGGASATPVCLNRAAPASANATTLQASASASAPITGLSTTFEVDHAGVVAGGHEELRLNDRLRIGQDGAIAIKVKTLGTDPSITWGVIFGFYE